MACQAEATRACSRRTRSWSTACKDPASSTTACGRCGGGAGGYGGACAAGYGGDQAGPAEAVAAASRWRAVSKARFSDSSAACDELCGEPTEWAAIFWCGTV